MKFLVTSDCYRSKGRAVVAGTVLDDATEDEARDLALAGRGRLIPDSAEQEEEAKPAPSKKAK